MTAPLRRADVLLRDVEQDLVVYDPTTGDAHLLNGTAAAIFELCDGVRSPADLCAEIASVLEEELDVTVELSSVQADVDRTLVELSTLGLLVKAAP